MQLRKLEKQSKSYGDEATDFDDEEVPKEGSNYNCLAVISLDSGLKKGESYYPQAFLKECSHIEKGRKSE